jgi:hypothetical protein
MRLTSYNHCVASLAVKRLCCSGIFACQLNVPTAFTECRKAKHYSCAVRGSISPYCGRRWECRLPKTRPSPLPRIRPKRSASEQKKELIPVFEDNRDTFKDDLEDRLTNHSLDIEFLLNERGRSRIERKFIIEPFLELLEKHEIRPSRKFPLTAMLKALYLVFGIKNPPSDIMVRQIVSDLKKKASRQKRPEG